MFSAWRSTRPAAGFDAAPATTLPLERLIAMRDPRPQLGETSPRGLTHLPGHARTRIRGRGLEFDDLRPYAEGDDLRHIDWNVTARMGRPFTRQFREERERALTVALDFRASMFTGSRRLKSVAAGEMAAALLWQVAAGRDRAGALIFDDRALEATRPAAREHGAAAAIGAIAAGFAEARSRIDGERPTPRPLDEILAWINRSRRAAGAFLLVTGFDHPGRNIEAELREAGERGRLGLILVRDSIETEGLPRGLYRYAFEGGTGSIRLDGAAAERLLARLAEKSAELGKLLRGCGVPFVEVSSAIEPAELFAEAHREGLV